MKTAIQISAEFFEARGASLAKELEYYIKYGYIFITPLQMMLAREINIDRGADEWVFNGSGNCWYVHWACGPGALDWFLRQAPHPKPYLAWRRWKKDTTDFPHLRIYKWEDVKNRLLKENFTNGR